MTIKSDILDAVVVGAGWAGLGVSHALIQRGLRHRVLERGRIGETWRTQRWASFRMNTPNVQTVMPGDRYDGSDPDGFLTRDLFVALLEDFAERNGLPVERDSPVTELAVGQENGAYRLATPRGTLRARNVVIASGNLNCPLRPLWAAALPRGLQQIDASSYRSAADLHGGAVLVVGSGQSGAQIAEDLAEAGRTVFLATSRVGRLSRRYRGKDIMIWLVQSGFLDVRREQIIQLSGRIPPRRFAWGGAHAKPSVPQRPRCPTARAVHGPREWQPSHFRRRSGGAHPLRGRWLRQCQTLYRRVYHSRRNDAAAAEPDPAEVVAARLPNPPIRSLDLAESNITTVIWCTGFQGDFSWVRLPGVLDAGGQPLHKDGVAALPGIYFAGLDFASTRRSGTILAISEEAARLVEHIAGRG